MKEQGPISEVDIDAAAVLPRVGDRKRFTGSAQVVVEDHYALTFLPGDGVSWDLHITRITGGVEISGRVSGLVTLECARCLENFDQPVDLRLREHALWLCLLYTSDAVDDLLCVDLGGRRIIKKKKNKKKKK